MTTLIIAVLLVLISSALCSGTEAALFSVSIIKVRQLADTGKKAALALLSIRENMNRPIAAIVILNNIANIVGSIAVGNLAASALGNQWLGLFSGVLTFFVIIFSEIIPKSLGERYSESVALFIARPVLMITKLLTPLVWAVEIIVSPLTKGNNASTTNESEIRLLAKIGQKEGVIELDESEMIQKVFELNDRTAADLMTPRVAMTYLKGTLSIKEAQETIIESPHSRIVIVEDTPDQVLGIALKDELLVGLIKQKGDSLVNEFMQKVLYVKQDVVADKLLPLFQEKEQHLAIVVDDYGGVSGIVTLEDVVEVLTGEIVDETDKVKNLQEYSSANNPYKS